MSTRPTRQSTQDDPSRSGDELVALYNAEDLEVYAFARRLHCARVRESGLVAAVEGFKLGCHFAACRGTGTPGRQYRGTLQRSGLHYRAH